MIGQLQEQRVGGDLRFLVDQRGTGQLFDDGQEIILRSGIGEVGHRERHDQHAVGPGVQRAAADVQRVIELQTQRRHDDRVLADGFARHADRVDDLIGREAVELRAAGAGDEDANARLVQPPRIGLHGGQIEASLSVEGRDRHGLHGTKLLRQKRARHGRTPRMGRRKAINFVRVGSRRRKRFAARFDNPDTRHLQSAHRRKINGQSHLQRRRGRPGPVCRQHAARPEPAVRTPIRRGSCSWKAALPACFSSISPARCSRGGTKSRCWSPAPTAWAPS